MSNPFKGEDPAASGDPQQNVEGASVTSGHHVSRALADLVDHGESTQRFYHLIHDLLLPKEEPRAFTQSFRNVKSQD